ncbi:MAG: NTP transferase domain-containing protein [Chitinivibrionales bacterium]|nr:NTP transferase domain-containing protein [Chitinivibrionales bacterium]
MNVLILAAGFGTRLKPLTNHIPKCLVSVCGKTLLQRNLELFYNQGFTSISVNAHYLPEQLVAAQENSTIRFRIFHEKEAIRGTGGAIHFARDFLYTDDYFCVSNVDIISTIDLQKLSRQFIASHAICGLVATAAREKGTLYYTPDNFSYYGTPATHKIVPPTIGRADFIGCAFYHKQLLDFVTPDDFSVIPIWERVHQEGYQVSVLIDDSIAWFDTGTIQELASIHFAVLDNKIALPIPSHYAIDYGNKIAYPATIDPQIVSRCGPYVWIDTASVDIQSPLNRCIVYDAAVVRKESATSHTIFTPWEEISFEPKS